MTAIDRARQTYCGIHGHDTLLQFEHHRLFLKCTSCGHETPGWALPDTRPQATGARAHQPRRLRPELTDDLRVA
ncbi:MAG: hypothetical protein GEU82_12285 [Luteitalea sp.]|nr:hypothetical protein [Luteitalea sp.]